MEDRCNISTFLLTDTNGKLAVPQPPDKIMLRKIVFLEQFFGIAFLLTSGKRSLFGFWGLAANNSSGGLHGTYVKQTKALSLIQFCDKHNAKVLEALILKQDYNSLIQESRKFVKITSKANGTKMRRGQD